MRKNRLKRSTAKEDETTEGVPKANGTEEPAKDDSPLRTLPEETSKLLTEGETEERPVKYSGLRGNPLSCGVNSATQSYKLSSPAVAARNLVIPLTAMDLSS